MRAVVLKGQMEVAVEDVPEPKIEQPTDVLIKVRYAGLCGSDLHWLRGHQGAKSGFVMGHEAVGEVVAVGTAVTNFKPGDQILSTFHTSCGNCFFCTKGYTSRCVKAQTLGGPGINGAQAEYMLVPLGETTLLHLPSDIPSELALLMTDVLPTGYSIAANSKRLADEDRDAPAPKKQGVCVVIGCGPVGLCTISSACTMYSKVFATDLQTSRLESAGKHGAIALPLDKLKEELLLATDGYGADAVLEVVGHPSALTTAIELVRPYGVISSGGLYKHPVQLEGSVLYDKNLRFQFGRCSVRSFYEPALSVLRDNIELFKGYFEHRVPIEEAPKYYGLFEQNLIGKTAFVL